MRHRELVGEEDWTGLLIVFEGVDFIRVGFGCNCWLFGLGLVLGRMPFMIEVFWVVERLVKGFGLGMCDM